jgi:spore germination protein
MKLTRLYSILFILFGFSLIPVFATAATPRTLIVGTTGSDVVALQTALISKGYLAPGYATGMFGPLTLAAVQKFQCDRKVVCSGSSYGIYGPLTRAALLGATGGNTAPAPSANIDPSTGGIISPLSSGQLNGQSAGPAWTGGLEVGGWIPYWREATGTADVLPHLADLTEVSPFVITMKSDGTINDAGGLGAEPWTSFIAAAKAQHVRVIPTVMWGDGATEQAILSDSTKRVALEDQIADFVKANNYDGIDIDFEAKEADTQIYFSTFLKGLYERMGQKWVYCSIESRMPLTDRYGYNTTPAFDATEYANDYVAINNYCDRVEIMAYDQGSIDTLLDASRAAPYVPVADPAWVENVVNLAAQTIDKKKIILGIPTYGYEYSVTPSSAGGYQYDLDWAFNPGYATQLAQELGVQPVRNSADELSFMYKPTPATDALTTIAAVPGSITVPSSSLANNTAPPDAVYSQTAIAGGMQPPFNIVWWSDSQAIADKVALAKKLGIRGVALFKFDGGEDPNMWNVLPKGVK